MSAPDGDAAGSATQRAGSRGSARMAGRLPTDLWTLGAIACLFAGIVLLVVAWYDVSGTANLYEQMPYLVSAGFSGLAFFIVGGALLIAGRSDRVERRLAQLVAAITESVDASPVSTGAPTPPAPEPLDLATDSFLVVPGTSTYHRPGCLLLRDKQAEPMSAADLAEGKRTEGLNPCPVCEPPDRQSTDPPDSQ